MSHTLSTQDAGVVLRSRHPRLRALLAIAMIALVSLTIAVVVLAINDSSNTITAAHANRQAISANPVVQPNPDEQGLTASPLGSNSSYYYPGHY
jgi:hypothetical protein